MYILFPLKYIKEQNEKIYDCSLDTLRIKNKLSSRFRIDGEWKTSKQEILLGLIEHSTCRESFGKPKREEQTMHNNYVHRMEDWDI